MEKMNKTIIIVNNVDNVSKLQEIILQYPDSKILVMADVAWKPNDNEMENIIFENYDWKKWKI